MQNNCYIQEIDLGIYKILSAEETIDLFGEDYLEDMGTYLPEELLKEYLNAQEISSKLNSDLYRIKKNEWSTHDFS